MLVKDLRNVIENYSEKDKENIIIELYKKIPKRVKEDYSIDEYIMDIRKPKLKEEKKVTFDDLEKEIMEFIKCANEGLYSEPNKIISKNERTKWRFKFKGYYKELSKILPDTLEGKKATYLLEELFKLISHSSVYLTFTNYETFRAIQVEQGEFYDNVMKRKLAVSCNDEILESCVKFLEVDGNPYGFSNELCKTFKSNLGTNDMKEIAVKIFKEKVIEFKENIKIYNKKSGYGHYVFELEEKNNNFVICVLNICFEIGKIDEGIAYYHKNYLCKVKEVKEYILLEEIENYELDDVWVCEYEEHLGKIDYRESLVERYNELKNL